jgi:predicted nucleotidyltransferase component of viral defense system
LRAEYYTKILYPLQDKVINAFKDSPFYLTGGTTLSRGHYNHRFSDDLDYFVNDHPDFERVIEKQILKLKDIFSELKIALKDVSFCRLLVAEQKLKIEMVNDVPSHMGELVSHPVLGIIDSKENILANKITAIIDRALPKDFVDVYFLLKDGLDIKQSLTDAYSKAAGISPLYLAKILAEYDYSILDSEIKWVALIKSSEIKNYLTDISMAIIQGKI